MPSTSVAAGQWRGNVIELRASNISSAVLFKLSGKLEKAASCNAWEMYAIDLNNPGGSAVFELVKYAYLNGLTVEARSLGTCLTHWKSEGVKDIYLKEESR